MYIKASLHKYIYEDRTLIVNILAYLLGFAFDLKNCKRTNTMIESQSVKYTFIYLEYDFEVIDQLTDERIFSSNSGNRLYMYLFLIMKHLTTPK